MVVRNDHILIRVVKLVVIKRIHYTQLMRHVCYLKAFCCED
jgi:hypothetical protein